MKSYAEKGGGPLFSRVRYSRSFTGHAISRHTVALRQAQGPEETIRGANRYQVLDGQVRKEGRGAIYWSSGLLWHIECYCLRVKRRVTILAIAAAHDMPPLGAWFQPDLRQPSLNRVLYKLCKGEVAA
jgi:hypothetical protein